MTLFFDGFDQFARTDRPEQLMRLAGYTLEGTVETAAGRRGGSSLTLYRAALSRNWSFGNQLAVGFAVKFDARGPMLAIRNATGNDNLITLSADSVSGLLNLNGAVGYVNPLKARWYYIEMELDRDAGIVRVFVNGKADVTAPLPSGIGQNVRIRLNPYEAVANDYGSRNVDDFYINDGNRQNPMQITTRFPSSDKTTEWSVTGTDSHYLAVTPPIDMLDKFIYSSKGDAYDSFVSSQRLPDDNPVKYLQLITLFRKATADPMSLEFNIDDQKRTESNISREWTYRYTQFSANGYTAESIVPAEFGVKLKL